MAPAAAVVAALLGLKSPLSFVYQVSSQATPRPLCVGPDYPLSWAGCQGLVSPFVAAQGLIAGGVLWLLCCGLLAMLGVKSLNPGKPFLDPNLTVSRPHRMTASTCDGRLATIERSAAVLLHCLNAGNKNKTALGSFGDAFFISQC